jgi:hypothetical protein
MKNFGRISVTLSLLAVLATFISAAPQSERLPDGRGGDSGRELGLLGHRDRPVPLVIRRSRKASLTAGCQRLTPAVAGRGSGDGKG